MTLPRNPESVDAEIDSLKENDVQLAARVRDLEKRIDTLQTPIWRRLWWWAYEGWPLWDLNAPSRRRRPWYH